MVSRTLLAVLLALLVPLLVSARASADEVGQPSDPTGSVATATVPENVTVAAIPVGGLTVAEAEAAVWATVALPLQFTFQQRTWSATLQQLRARAYVENAVRRALVAAPGDAVRLAIAVRGERVRRYVRYLARIFDRPPVDSSLVLRGMTPRLTPARPGRAVRRQRMVQAIVRALVRVEREPIKLAVRWLKPKVTRGSFGPVVVVRRRSNWLYYYGRGALLKRRFRVATGSEAYDTPLGSFRIVVKQRHPWWYPPPNAPWARGKQPVPPGPDNPLGTRWMGLSASGVGIHGTPDAASVGYSASHGCIRMLIPDAEWLFRRVDLGTPVLVLEA